MKKTLFITLVLFMISCSVSKEPDFVKLDDYKIESANRKEIKLSTKAYFHNPNDIGCEIESTDIDVLVNDLFVSKVNQANSISLLANNEFVIPLNVNIPSEKIIKDKTGIINGVLSTLLNKNLTVTYKGVVTLKKGIIKFDVEIEGEEVLKEFKKF